MICSVCRNHNPALSPFLTYHRVCYKSNTTSATYGAETVFPFRSTLRSHPVFSGVRVARSVFCVIFYRSLFVLLYFFFCLLNCLSFFDLWPLITPLASSNLSYTGTESKTIVNSVLLLFYVPELVGPFS